MSFNSELTDTLIALIPEDGSWITNAEIQAALEQKCGESISDAELQDLKSRVIAMEAAEGVRGPGGGLKAPGAISSSGAFTGVLNPDRIANLSRGSTRGRKGRSPSSFEQAFRAIDDCLRQEAGCSTELDYTEQTSWLLFLKYLDGLEEDRAAMALLEGLNYTPILSEKFRWNRWAAPKNSNGQLDHNFAVTGDDLHDFVNQSLFPYLEQFKQRASGSNTIEYKIGEIFNEIGNKITSGYNLREIIDVIDGLRFRSQAEKYELSMLYEEKIKRMGNAGRNGGEYYTPRPLIRAIVQVVNPQIGETVYDPAVGSGGFLCEAFDFMRDGRAGLGQLGTQELETLQLKTFTGKEKKGLAYVVAIMNMILHGIEAPNIIRTNTLSENIDDLQERNRFDVVLANPPFGGNERSEVQENFSIKTAETAILFLQHFVRSLKVGGRAGIVMKSTFLSNPDNASIRVREKLLKECCLHTILLCPTGTFQGTGEKTAILFFEKGNSTNNVWFYELSPERNLGKSNPLRDEDLEDFLLLQKEFQSSACSWSIGFSEINRSSFSLSFANPNSEGFKAVPVLELANGLKEIQSLEASASGKIYGFVDDIRVGSSEDFQRVPLGEIANIQAGSGFPKRYQGQEDGNIHFYKVSDMNLSGNELEMTSSNNAITENVRVQIGAYLFPPGTVIFPKIGGAIKTDKKRITAESCCVDNNVMGIFPKAEKVTTEYLYYLLLSKRLIEFSNDANYPSITKSTLEKWEVRVPYSLAVQEQICSDLSALVESVREMQKLCDRKKETLSKLNSSLLSVMLTGS